MDYILEYTQKGVDYWWRLIQDDQGNQKQIGSGIVPEEDWNHFLIALGITTVFSPTIKLVERN